MTKLWKHVISQWSEMMQRISFFFSFVISAFFHFLFFLLQWTAAKAPFRRAVVAMLLKAASLKWPFLLSNRFQQGNPKPKEKKKSLFIILLIKLLCWESFTDTCLKLRKQTKQTNKLKACHFHSKFRTCLAGVSQVILWKSWDNTRVARTWVCPKPDNNCIPLLALQQSLDIAHDVSTK